MDSSKVEKIRFKRNRQLNLFDRLFVRTNSASLALSAPAGTTD